MQIKAKNKERGYTYGQAMLVAHDTAENLVGRVCMHIEALGLKDTQEKAIKDILKREIYSMFGYDHGARYVDENLNTTLRLMWEKMDEEARKRNEPSGRLGDYEIVFTEHEVKEID